jgi:putative MATE family efflux protein
MTWKNRKKNETITSDLETKGVKTLLGDPKKAIIKLAVPMIIAMSVQTVYNFVDALWVSGLGSKIFTNVNVTDIGEGALAAIGLVLPFFMMAIAISTGLGVGSGSAISRRIGSKDKKGADNVAIHSIMFTIIIAAVFSFLFYVFADQIFTSISSGDSARMAISYGRVIFAFSFFVFFINIATAILRGEGDANRAMYAIILGSVLNIFLDPIFIFTFGWGVTGAAYATMLSMGISTLILLYWLFFRKDTFVTFKFKAFRFKKDIVFDIFRVGLPASFQQISMSITMLIINIIIVKIALGGDNGLAVYSTGWRVVMLAVLPLLGMATAVVSVSGAAYGAKRYDKLNTGFIFSIKLGLLIEIFVAILIFIIAPFLALIFSSSASTPTFTSDLEMFIKITCLFYPGAAIGIMSSAMFQGVGKGIYSLVSTLLRTLILTVILSLILINYFQPAMLGIWWALVIANLTGSIVSFTWGKLHIKKIKEIFRKENATN